MLLIRFLQAVIIFCVLGIILVVFQSGAASARQGVFVRDFVGFNSATIIKFDNPDIARTFYGELKGLGRPAIFSFKANKGFLLQAKIYIPRVEGLEDYRPALALAGPGLPSATPDQLDHLPFSLPADAGLVTSEEMVNLGQPSTPLPEYNEPFTQSDYGEGQKLLREIPQDGTYYLVVFSRVGQGGKYALQVGDKTETGIKEILSFPVLWSRVHNWFGDWLTPLVAWVVVALLALYGLYQLLRPFLNFRRKSKKIGNKKDLIVNAPVLPGTLDETAYTWRVSPHTPAPRLKYDADPKEARPPTTPRRQTDSEPEKES